MLKILKNVGLQFGIIELQPPPTWLHWPTLWCRVRNSCCIGMVPVGWF